MKQNKKVIIRLICLVLSITILAVYFAFSFKVNLNTNSPVCLEYPYEGSTATRILTDEESITIIEMFNDKKLTWDPGLSCGFDSGIYLSIGNGFFKTKFHPARDGCDIVMCRGKVFDLTTDEGVVLDSIFNKYGFSFPYL